MVLPRCGAPRQTARREHEPDAEGHYQFTPPSREERDAAAAEAARAEEAAAFAAGRPTTAGGSVVSDASAAEKADRKATLKEFWKTRCLPCAT